MEKYNGKKSFEDFFKYLSEQGRNDLYEKVDERTIFDFTDSLYPLKLPKQYLEFMRYAGSGQFWVGSSYSFSEVPKLKNYAEDLLTENEFSHRLKDDDFVFWMHGGYIFYYFNLNEGENPPVYYYSECDDMTDFIKCRESFTDFIIDPYITGVPNP